MDNLELAKNRLRTALDNLKAVVEKNSSIERRSLAKQNSLEIENNDLKANLLLLKKELAEIRQKTKTPTLQETEQDNLSINDIYRPKEKEDKDDNMSLNELKSLVGSKKWG